MLIYILKAIIEKAEDLTDLKIIYKNLNFRVWNLRINAFSYGGEISKWLIYILNLYLYFV